MALRLASLLSLFAFILPISDLRAEEPPLPAGIDPLPKDLGSRLRDLLKETEKHRGLVCLHPVASGSLGEEILKKKMLESFDEELPPSKMNPLESTLKGFGFIPDSMSLAKYYPELLTSQVAGYYDPRRKYLVVVQRVGGILGAKAKEQFGEAMAQKMEETVLVHELTHAIQDQHFDLRKFMIEDPLSDEGAARQALVEGDATLTMYNFMSGMKMEDMPGVETVMNMVLKDPEQLMAMSPDMPGSKEMAAAPAWFRDNLLFAYMQGFVFCISVKKLGGQALLDHAFKKDPPKSTEQLIHPEKWHTQRDDPIAIEWPDLAKALPNHKKLAVGQWGEQSTKIFLREQIKLALKDGAVDAEKVATQAAAGWGGDRFGVYEKDGKLLLLWLTEWDSNQDAQEFRDAMRRLGKEWMIHAPRPGRVIAMKGTLNAAEIAEVEAALTAATATVPENKALDLAALGIKKKAGGGALDGGLGGLEALMGDPNVQKLAEQLLGGAADKDGKLDIKGMMENPMVQNMMKDMMKGDKPAGTTSADGLSHVNVELGFSVTLPAEQKDWSISKKPANPMSSVELLGPEGLRMEIVAQPFPLGEMPMDQVGPMVEMSIPMMIPNYKKVSSGAIKLDGKTGWDLQFTGSDPDGKMPIRATQRMFFNGGKLLIVSVMGGPKEWGRNEKAIEAVLKGVSLAPKK